MNTTLSALSGANLIFSCGSLESGLTFDYAKLMMDAEHIRRLQRVLDGIVVSDQTLALDVIHEIGPGGTFIEHEHTFDNRHNMSQAKLFDRRSRDQWLSSANEQDLTERAYAAAAEIIALHRPMPLSQGCAEIMSAIIEEAENQNGDMIQPSATPPK